MMGCLTLPLRLLGLLLLVLLVAAGWLYREEFLRLGRRALGMADPPSPVGWVEPGAADRARARVEQVVRAGADSVVLTPVELASLVAEQLRRVAAGSADSVTVELGTRELTIRGLVSTEPVPASLRDLLGGVVGEREPVELTGLLGLRRAGVAEFEVRRVRVRGLPVPRELVGRLVGRYVAEASGASVLVAVPPGISGIRVTPRGVVLYGGRSP